MLDIFNVIDRLTVHLKYNTSAASGPRIFFESHQCRVDSDFRALLIHTIRIAGAHSRDQWH